MEEKSQIIETLIEKATDYGKTSIELIKLKALEKASDTISSFIPLIIVFFLFASFLLMINLGLAIWLGEIFGEISYGFFVVGGFYGLLAILLHFFLNKGIKRIVRNNIIKLLLN
jgi:hypothetical protein